MAWNRVARQRNDSKLPAMNPSLETLASEALLLPEGQRLTLAHRILASVEPLPEPGIPAMWEAEIRERIRKYDAGLSAGIPGSQVFAELDKKLKRRLTSSFRRLATSLRRRH